MSSKKKSISTPSAIDNLERIVMVIDADNTQVSRLEAVIQEVSTYGRIVVKRAYGNWRKDTLKRWENEIKRLAIKAQQQFDYVSGKNATDMAMVIDTLDLLHTGEYDAFVIVASDSDYTPLAIRLHESGVYVIGVGERKTPIAFRNSCDEFIYLENLRKTRQKSQSQDKNQASSESRGALADGKPGDSRQGSSEQKASSQDGKQLSGADGNKSGAEAKSQKGRKGKNQGAAAKAERAGTHTDAVQTGDVELAEPYIHVDDSLEGADGTHSSDQAYVREDDKLSEILKFADAWDNDDYLDSIDSSMDSLDEIHELLQIASDKYQDNEGYTYVSSAGAYIKRAKPDFDSRSFGFVKLPQLLEAFPDRYEVKRQHGKGNVTIIVYRCL